MSLLFSAATTDRVDLAADGARDITRGAILAWVYPTVTQVARFACLVDPVNLRNAQDTGIVSAGANLQMAHDFGGTDLIANALLSNFPVYALNKWLRIAFVWDHGAGNAAQKMYMGDESTGLAEPSAYVTQQDGAGGWLARDASSFWKLANRRQNDSSFDGRIAYTMLVDRSAGVNPTAAEMDRWFKAPGRFDDAVWLYELGIGGNGLSVRNLVGGGATYVGTINGATVDPHIAMKPFLQRSMVGTSSRGGVLQRRRRLAFSRAHTQLVSTFQGTSSTMVLTGAIASATASAFVGSLSLGGSITLTGTLADASASALPGTLNFGGTITLAGQRADAQASALAGTLGFAGGVTLSGSRADATATALVGSIGFSIVLPTVFRFTARPPRQMRDDVALTIDCSQDFVPDVLVEKKADSTGRWIGATGISGVTMRLSAAPGGPAIHTAFDAKATSERSAIAGQLYPTSAFEVADLQAHLLSTLRGHVIYLVLDKPGDIVGKSLRCLVTANGE